MGATTSRTPVYGSGYGLGCDRRAMIGTTPRNSTRVGCGFKQQVPMNYELIGTSVKHL